MEDLLWKVVKNNKKVSQTLEDFIFAFMDAIKAENYDLDDIRSHMDREQSGYFKQSPISYSTFDNQYHEQYKEICSNSECDQPSKYVREEIPEEYYKTQNHKNASKTWRIIGGINEEMIDPVVHESEQLDRIYNASIFNDMLNDCCVTLYDHNDDNLINPSYYHSKVEEHEKNDSTCVVDDDYYYENHRYNDNLKKNIHDKPSCFNQKTHEDST